MNGQWTGFPNLSAKNTPRRVDMLLKSIKVMTTFYGKVLNIEYMSVNDQFHSCLYTCRHKLRNYVFCMRNQNGIYAFAMTWTITAFTTLCAIYKAIDLQASNYQICKYQDQIVSYNSQLRIFHTDPMISIFVYSSNVIFFVFRLKKSKV